MGINISLLGQFTFIIMFVIGGLSYYLGKRKTTSPILATLIGTVLCMMPPLNIIYLIVLMLKSDVISEENIKGRV